jgi:signal transduction histidine kinase
LFAIQGHLQLMELDQELSAKNRERLGVIDDSCRRLVAIVSDILDLAKMQARRMSYAMARVSLPDAVAPVLAAFQALAQKGGVALAARLPADLPPVRADAARVQQVLTNLLSNALKFTPRGGSATVSARRDAAFVVLEVRDTGPGIPAEQMSLLFQKFSQLPGAARAKAAGTGLGLAISKEIVEAHGGKIWAESAPGRGTAFLFTLPVEAGA